MAHLYEEKDLAAYLDKIGFNAPSIQPRPLMGAYERDKKINANMEAHRMINTPGISTVTDSWAPMEYLNAHPSMHKYPMNYVVNTHPILTQDFASTEPYTKINKIEHPPKEYSGYAPPVQPSSANISSINSASKTPKGTHIEFNNPIEHNIDNSSRQYTLEMRNLLRSQLY